MHRVFIHDSGPIEFGRIPAPGAVARFVLFDDTASKRHLRVTEAGGRRILLENLSGRSSVSIEGGDPLGVGQNRAVPLPVVLHVGQTRLDVEYAGAGDSEPPPPDSSLGFQTIAAPIHAAAPAGPQSTFVSLRSDLSPERLLRWFETLVLVQRAAAGSREFYAQTAEALVQLVGLDYGVVLLPGEEGWRVAAEHRAGESVAGSRVAYSHSLVRSVQEQKRTLYRNAKIDDMSKSMADFEAVVASPIFDSAGEVVGVLYGSKGASRDPSFLPIGPLEAQVVQLLAAAVGTGLARLEQETSAARSRARFEQFFSRELAEELARNPALLEGREREVTVLFADVRGFSRLAQRLDPKDYYSLGQDVLGRMTEEVQAERGVVVDYTGDGLLAMWNAPFDQEDHAEAACRAALAMVDALPELARRWGALAGGPIELGIGVSTGPALVGNTGTALKLKYGPRGHVVNLGSRVEAATKALGVRVLATKATRDRLVGVHARRIGLVRLPGIADPQQLFEIRRPADEKTAQHIAHYERALEAFEAQKFADAESELRIVLSDATGELDLPTFQLLARVLACRKNPPRSFDPSWSVESK
jgi:adenylate cyclase